MNAKRHSTATAFHLVVSILYLSFNEASVTTMATKTQNFIFFHPDLGIGGAERLVLDAAVGLQDRGHRITIFTSHRDPKHCFDEARDGE